MKRIITICLMLLLSLTLLGCGKTTITKEKYDKLSEADNLTYKQAAKIIGSEGKLDYENKEFKMKKYIWKDEENNIELTIDFEDDRRVTIVRIGYFK